MKTKEIMRENIKKVTCQTRVVKVIILFIATLVLISNSSNAALASYHAIGYVQPLSSSQAFLGGYAQWKTPQMYTTIDGGFTSQVLWVGTQNSTSISTWVEVGLTKGWKGNNNVWTMYWAENTPTYNEYQVTSILPGSAGTLHHYQAQYDAWNTWGVYIDYTKVGTSSQSAGSMGVEAGGEISSSQNTLTSTYPQYMQVLDKANSWHYWGDYGDVYSYSDSPFIWEWQDPGTYKLGKDYKQ